VDGSKALSKAIRRTFGADIPIQRGCPVTTMRLQSAVPADAAFTAATSSNEVAAMRRRDLNSVISCSFIS
ncbi:MAG: hypothetical protein WCJ41_20760, partial [Aestuariivirga sp.]|uniref:hypothetical protein n=1 Tax=Aestuariivirga sp. TaxID=2650926 RepID=UPI003018DC3C